MIDSNIKERPWYAKLERWAVEHANPEAIERDREARFDREVWNTLALSTGTGVCISKDFGGLGLNALECAEYFEALGYLCTDAGFNFCLAAHTFAGVVPIMLHGTEEQKKYFLPSLNDGSWMAANAITESSSGSDAFEMNARAEPVESQYQLSGTKTYVTNAPQSDVCLFYAKTHEEKGFLGGVSCFLLERSNNQYECGANESKLGLRGCTMSKVSAAVTVGENQRLGREGRGGFVFHESMLWERGILPALYLGTVSRLMEKTISFVSNRISGGKPIGKHQAISHQIVEILTKLKAARLLVREAAKSIDSGRETVRCTSMAKWYTSEFYKETMVKLHQIHGGESFRGHHDIERHLRDSMGSTLYSGTTEIQKNIIAGTFGL